MGAYLGVGDCHSDKVDVVVFDCGNVNSVDEYVNTVGMSHNVCMMREEGPQGGPQALVEALLWGKKVDVLIDTGATILCVSIGLLCMFGQEHLICKWNGGLIRTATGAKWILKVLLNYC